MLDKNLKYKSQKIDGNTITIYVKSMRKKAECANCGKVSRKIHSQSIRKIQDLPIQGKKVKIALERRKFFCINQECPNKTFAEPFDFFEPMSRKTRRLSVLNKFSV